MGGAHRGGLPWPHSRNHTAASHPVRHNTCCAPRAPLHCVSRCPEQCPEDIAQLIEACISSDIAQRPTAAAVVAQLRHMLYSSQPVMQVQRLGQALARVGP